MISTYLCSSDYPNSCLDQLLCNTTQILSSFFSKNEPCDSWTCTCSHRYWTRAGSKNRISLRPELHVCPICLLTSKIKADSGVDGWVLQKWIQQTNYRVCLTYRRKENLSAYYKRSFNKYLTNKRAKNLF